MKQNYLILVVFTLTTIIIQSCTAVRNPAAEDSDSDVFGSNHHLPTFHLYPFQDIRSAIRDIQGDDYHLTNRDQRDTSTDRDNIEPPWRHHIDFDELFPGEDQIADENEPITVEQTPPVGENRPERTGSRSSPSINVVDTAHPFSSFFNSRITSRNWPFGMMGNSEHDIMPDFFGAWAKPWWEGPNVCINREEENGIVVESFDSNENNQTESESLIDNNNDDYDLPTFHMKISSCKEKHDKHSCETNIIGPNVNKTIKTDYECCPGYLLSNKKECTRGTLKSIANTLEEIGAKEFNRLIKKLGLHVKLASNQNLTVFVPTDDSIASFMQSHRDINSNEITISTEREAYRRRRNILMHNTSPIDFYTSEQVHPVSNIQRSTNQLPEPNFEDDDDWKTNALSQQNRYSNNNNRHSNTRSRSRQNLNDINYSHEYNNENLQQLLLNHMIQGKLSTDDFVDEQILYSETKGNNSVLRLNTWNVNGEKIHTINCARMVTVNHRCSNGLIHMINGVISPVTKTIADIITSHEDLTILKSLSSVSGLLSSFRDRNGHFTIFAPTNAAMQRLGQHTLSKLRNGDPCLKRILKNHILPITLCSSIITQKGQVRNLNHELLAMERTNDDKLFVNDTQIITRDIVTVNGIIHIIDAVLRTEQDTPIVTALERGGFTSFLEQLSNVGLKDDLDDLSNITIFAPSNKAMESLPESLLRNRTRLRDILLYHIAVPETRACHFSNDQQLKTRLNNKFIRINLNSKGFPLLQSLSVVGPGTVTAQCGILEHINKPACNGIIHTVDRILIPSDMNLFETLKTQSDLSIFTRLLQDTDLIDTLKGGIATFTVFAPTDEAFYKLPKDKLEKILKDKEESLKILKLHIVKDNLCCSGISPSVWFLTKQVEALNGLHIPVYRDAQGKVMIGTSQISACDLTSSNGVIHTMSTLLDFDEVKRPGYMQSCLISNFPF